MLECCLILLFESSRLAITLINIDNLEFNIITKWQQYEEEFMSTKDIISFFFPSTLMTLPIVIFNVIRPWQEKNSSL